MVLDPSALASIFVSPFVSPLLAFASPAGFLGQFGSLPLIVLMMVVMYFLLIAPNQKKQKTWAAMLASLKTGDRVTTNAGIRGTIVSVKDDVLILRCQPDNIKLEFVKSAIAAVTTDDAPATT